MKATRSGIVIGLALALLVPMNVVGQESSPPAEAPTGFLALEDASGDLYDTFTDEPIDGPAYADITAMDVEKEFGIEWPYAFYGNPDYLAKNRADCKYFLSAFHYGELPPGPGGE